MQTATKASIIENARKYVQEEMSKDSSGHDWWHIHRVSTCAKKLAEKCGADIFTVELAALLHDVGDYKLRGPSGEKESEIARRWLVNERVDIQVIEHICDIIDCMSFKGAGVTSSMKTLEGKVVQDADRLDAIGAIGIARTFAYGGNKGQSMHDPELAPQFHQTMEQYRTSRTSSINHFHEKLLLLKDLLNTEPAKVMAQGRHDYMVQFIEQFEQEWQGER